MISNVASHNRLLFRITLMLVGISTVFAAVLSLLQLGLEYRQQQQFLHRHLVDFEHSQQNALANSLWTMDIASVAIQLRGLAQDPYIRYLRLTAPLQEPFTVGEGPTENAAFRRTIVLRYRENGEDEEVGVLEVHGNYEKVVARLRHGLPRLLFLEGAKIFGFAFCTLLLFYVFFSRYLTEIARRAEKIDLDTLAMPITLSRRQDDGAAPDELDRIVSSLNTMRQRLHDGLLERQRAEHALQKSEEKYRALIETTETGYVIVDVGGRVVDANFQYVRLSGHRRLEEIVGRSVLEWTAPHDQERNGQEIRRCLARGYVRNLEIDYANPAADMTPVEINATVIDDDGERLILTMVRDISERRRAADALAAEKERLIVTLRSIGDGVICTNTSGRITLINPAAEKLTGWPQGEAMGRPIAEVFWIINERTRKICTNPVDKVLQTGRVVGLANHTALVARDGREFPIADSGAPIRDRNSEIIGVVLVFRDASHERRQEEERLKVKKLESVGVLAGGIAHDFNNILATILGNINLANMKLGDNHQCSQLLQEAEKGADRARQLTNQLLTFAKGGEPVTETAAIAQVVRESVDFVLHGTNVNTVYDLPDDLWLVDIDQGQISQVIQNLAINAKQAMPEGGTLRVSAENCHDPDFLAAAKGDYLRLTISDTGVGIPPKVVDRIFDPYFSTKQTGSGLGLAITHSIINRHHGYITVSSSVDQGTTFTILLPASDGELPTPAAKQPAAALASCGRILVMDDEQSVRNIARQMLEHLGCTVALAEDGEQAIKLYEAARRNREPFDLVIVDLTIPGGMGGLEAAQRIKAMEPAARILVSSGYSQDPIMAQAKQHGFAGALAKPYRLEELQGVLGEVLATGGKQSRGDL